MPACRPAPPSSWSAGVALCGLGAVRPVGGLRLAGFAAAPSGSLRAQDRCGDGRRSVCSRSGRTLRRAASPCRRRRRTQTKINVVATFSILADLVKNVGGDRVEVATLVGPNGDAHVYQPSPADAKKLAARQGRVRQRARLRRLDDAPGQGLRHQGRRSSSPPRASSRARWRTRRATARLVTDPHAWQSVANAKIYVANIRDALVAADPAGKAAYEANAAAYLGKLDALDRRCSARSPRSRPTAAKSSPRTTASAISARLRGDFIAPQGVSTESEASAQDVAKIITQIRRQKIPAVFLENVTDPRLMQRDRPRNAAPRSAARSTPTPCPRRAARRPPTST